jgi:hypothetical protein
MFADEARFGRMNRPRPCWAPRGTRPLVASQLIREYCVYLILPAPDTQCFQIFLNTLAKKYRRQLILLFVDGTGKAAVFIYPPRARPELPSDIRHRERIHRVHEAAVGDRLVGAQEHALGAVPL